MTKTNHEAARLAGAAGLALTALWLAAGAHAQSDMIDSVLSEQVEIGEAAQRSQVRVAQLDDEADEMFAEYRQALAMTRSLEAYNQQMSRMVESQNGEIARGAAERH